MSIRSPIKVKDLLIDRSIDMKPQRKGRSSGSSSRGDAARPLSSTDDEMDTVDPATLPTVSPRSPVYLAGRRVGSLLFSQPCNEPSEDVDIQGSYDDCACSDCGDDQDEVLYGSETVKSESRVEALYCSSCNQYTWVCRCNCQTVTNGLKALRSSLSGRQQLPLYVHELRPSYAVISCSPEFRSE